MCEKYRSFFLAGFFLWTSALKCPVYSVNNNDRSLYTFTTGIVCGLALAGVVYWVYKHTAIGDDNGNENSMQYNFSRVNRCFSRFVNTITGHVNSFQNNWGNVINNMGTYSYHGNVDGLSMQLNNYVLTVAKRNCVNMHLLPESALSGQIERVPLTEKVHTITFPSFFAQVAVVQEDQNAYIEIDKVVSDSGLVFKVVNGALSLSFANPECNGFRFSNVFKTQLVKICVHLLGNALTVSSTALVATTVLSLNRLEVSGASKVEVQGALLQKLVVSGNSSVRISNLIVQQLHTNISGASRVIILDGNTEVQEIEVSGASKYQALKCASNNVNANVSGSSRVYVQVAQNLNGSVSGASRIEYKGNPFIGRMEVKKASSCKRSKRN